MDGDDKTPKNEGEEAAGWNYNSGSTTDNPAPAAGSAVPAAGGDGSAVEWSASEFVAHEKGFGWYALLFGGAILIAAVLYLLTKDVLAAFVALTMALILAVAGARKPRVLEYRLDASGLMAGKKFYPYRQFKAFAIPEDGHFASIVLIPLRRFDFPVSAYLAPDSQQKAVELLSNHLPLERGELDSVERLMRQIRF